MVDGKRNMVGMSLPDETIERLGEIANRHGWSRSQLVNKLVEFYDRVTEAWERCQFDPAEATRMVEVAPGQWELVYETDEEAQFDARRRLARNKKIFEGVMASGLIPPGVRTVAEPEPKMRVETEE